MAYTVTVTWMGGKEEKYRADEYPRTVDGALHVVEHYGITGGIKEDMHIPLDNVRTWEAERT